MGDWRSQTHADERNSLLKAHMMGLKETRVCEGAIDDLRTTGAHTCCERRVNINNYRVKS